MKLVDWLQILSLLAVAGSLCLAALQTRSVAVQAREVTRQSRITGRALEQSAHLGLVGHSSDSLTFLITSEPRMLEWFLRTRGIPTGDHERNKLLMFLFIRADIHESNYISYLEDSLSDDIWLGWLEVVRSDCATREWALIWPAVKRYYSARFVAFVDELLEEAAVAPKPRRG
ncbi:hypothetical protein [Actinoplanes solisilvae]|uniref:hypothetical protein n=1 Tax=Actinoplanes solisilvae TaxID=2486853 RepID=UPI000FD70FD7|nr:hypothetical protein [Actinoplanes solisilvae]